MGDPFAEALAHHKAGRTSRAARLYERLLSSDPRHPGALNLLGVIRLGQGRTADGVRLMERAVAQTPSQADSFYNLGSGLDTLGRLDEADAALRRAILLRPDYAAAHLNLSGVLLRLRKPREAFTHARQAAELSPGLAEAYCNAGLALRATGFPTRAEDMFRAALTATPDHPPSLHNLANLLRQDPGNAHREGDDADTEAQALFRRLLALHPDRTETHVALSCLLRDRGESEAAQNQLMTARRLSPDDALLRLALTMAPLQALYRDDEERRRARATYHTELVSLDAWVRAGGNARLSRFADVAGAMQPFSLPYSDPADVDETRRLQILHATLVVDANLIRHGAAAIAPLPAPGDPIRIGFVSGYMRDHSNWKIPLGGWMEAFSRDRDRFALFGYHTGETVDAITEHAATLCERFVQGPLSTAAWRDEIARDRPHVLIWPETGMDGSAFRLAAMRLAPLQCVSWGHPLTSGLPTIDAFISSAAMEPDDADRQYSEELIRLPGLGYDYKPPPRELSTATRACIGLPDDATIFFCGQSLFKYLPAYDAVLARIAHGVPNARFVFVETHRGGRVRSAMKARLAARSDLDADKHCIFLDRLSQPDFVAVAGMADIVLDNIGWSGCNSTLEGLVHGTPVITHRGPTMRGRHGAAIMDAIGAGSLVADTEDDYVARAIELAHDAAQRARLRHQLRENHARAYGDAASSAALCDWVERRLRSQLP